jgi:hypothetical protein
MSCVQLAAVTVPGDVWLLGRHRLVCGDSTDAAIAGPLTFQIWPRTRGMDLAGVDAIWIGSIVASACWCEVGTQVDVRRSKTDAADAKAICEAVGRPRMRFLPVKSTHQQGRTFAHRARDLPINSTNPPSSAIARVISWHRSRCSISLE